MLSKPTHKGALPGLSLPTDEELFSIDLSGTTLDFTCPKCSIDDTEFIQGYPKDLRPFVNTVSRAEFQFSPHNKRGTCEFYESGWYLDSRKWWKRARHGKLKLLVSLETPAAEEYETYPNLFDENCLKNWLLLYYRDRQDILNRTAFTQQDDGAIEITFFNEKDVEPVRTDSVPLKKLPEPVSGLPCYFIYLNPGIVEFTLPIGRRDVLQIRFQLKYLTDNPDVKKQLNELVLNFSAQLLNTVQIKLSARERQHKNKTSVFNYIINSL